MDNFCVAKISDGNIAVGGSCAELAQNVENKYARIGVVTASEPKSGLQTCELGVIVNGREMDAHVECTKPPKP